MKHLQKICLSCQYFRPLNTDNGVCRLDKTLSPEYPVMLHTDSCSAWKTSGQQYYIRAGWLRNQMENQSDEASVKSSE